MQHKILMIPNYCNSLFEDEKGRCVGGYDCLFIEDTNNEIELNLKDINEIEKWFNEWEKESLYNTNHWKEQQWKDWWQRGLELAKTIKKLLPKNIELYYFSLNEPIWKIQPNETDDGGVFNIGEPILIHD